MSLLDQIKLEKHGFISGTPCLPFCVFFKTGKYALGTEENLKNKKM